MKNENELKQDGMTFIAVESDRYCIGCHFEHTLDCPDALSKAECMASHRADGREIIWKLKQFPAYKNQCCCKELIRTNNKCMALIKRYAAICKEPNLAKIAEILIENHKK